MKEVQLHLHVPTHANIYLAILSSHVQNFIWLVKKFVLQFVFCIDPQQIDNCFCLPYFGRSQRKPIL